MKRYRWLVATLIVIPLIGIAAIGVVLFGDGRARTNGPAKPGDMIKWPGEYSFIAIDSVLEVDSVEQSGAILSYRLVRKDGTVLLSTDPSVDGDSMYVRWFAVMDGQYDLWVWASDYSGCTRWKRGSDGSYTRQDLEDDGLKEVATSMPPEFLDKLPRTVLRRMELADE